MNISKAAFLIVLLLCVAILAGCQEENARLRGPNVGRQVALEPSVTGFWQSRSR